jgi:hypothetical protein
VLRLVQTNLAGTWQADRRLDSPGFFVHLGAFRILGFGRLAVVSLKAKDVAVT